MGVLQAIADVILIVAALLSLLAFAFLAYAALIIIRLVKETKAELSTLTGAGKDSLQEARATGRFVSESIVKPASMAFGYVTAIRATMKALTEDVVKKARS